MAINEIKFFFLLMGCISLCCKKATTKERPLSSIELSAEKKYFLEVAFGSEITTSYNNIRKWEGDVNIFLPDSSLAYLNEEVTKVIDEINTIQKSITLKRVYKQTESNFIIYFGHAEDYVTLYEAATAPYISANDGMFWIYWNNNYTIYKGSMYVDYFRVTESNCERHLVREELTQALGLMNDSYEYPESIFYQPWTCGTAYASMDTLLIKYLYNPLIKAGMSKSETTTLIKNF